MRPRRSHPQTKLESEISSRLTRGAFSNATAAGLPVPASHPGDWLRARCAAVEELIAFLELQGLNLCDYLSAPDSEPAPADCLPPEAAEAALRVAAVAVKVADLIDDRPAAG